MTMWLLSQDLIGNAKPRPCKELILLLLHPSLENTNLSMLPTKTRNVLIKITLTQHMNSKLSLERKPNQLPTASNS